MRKVGSVLIALNTIWILSATSVAASCWALSIMHVGRPLCVALAWWALRSHPLITQSREQGYPLMKPEILIKDNVTSRSKCVCYLKAKTKTQSNLEIMHRTILTAEVFSSTEHPDYWFLTSNQYSKKTSCQCFRKEGFFLANGEIIRSFLPRMD